MANPKADTRPPAADAEEVREKVAAIVRQAASEAGVSSNNRIEIFETATTAILALLTPTFLAENAKKEGFREGVEASAALVDQIEQMYPGGSGGSYKECRRNQSELIATAIRALPDPAQAVGERG